MLSSLVFVVIVLTPIALFLFGQLRAYLERQDAARPKTVSPGMPPPPRVRRARARRVDDVDCGRNGAHLLLTLAGARDSCRHCIAIRERHAAAATPELQSEPEESPDPPEE